MVSTIPLPYGYITGRYLYAIGDTSKDGDRLPDAVPAQGTITATPATPRNVLTSPEPITAIGRPVTLRIDSEGYILDEAGNRGAWLVAGTYNLAFSFVGVPYPGFPITVTTDHTEAAPLDLSLAPPLDPTPAVKFVVNEEVYLGAVAARDEAIAARDEMTRVLAALNDGQGIKGDPGTDGRDGIDGKDGTNGRDGIDGLPGLPGTPGTNGTNGRDGINGVNGRDGVDGITPDTSTYARFVFVHTGDEPRPAPGGGFVLWVDFREDPSTPPAAMGSRDFHLATAASTAPPEVVDIFTSLFRKGY